MDTTIRITWRARVVHSQNIAKQWPEVPDFLLSVGRSGRIWTCDPHVPNKSCEQSPAELSAFFDDARPRLFTFCTSEAVAATGSKNRALQTSLGSVFVL